jgi:hypothetical protein
MRYARTLSIALTAGAVAFAPLAVAQAKSEPRAKFAVTKLSLVPHKSTFNVYGSDSDLTVKALVRVKDFDKKFEPSTVKLVVREKLSGELSTTVGVMAVLKGKSKVVSHWSAKITVPNGTVAEGDTATYCIALVKVDDASSATLPAVQTAKGLAGRDCFTVINTERTKKH